MDAIATMSADLYDRIVAKGRETRETAVRELGAGAKIPAGQRNDTLFHIALRMAHDGLDESLILPSVLAVNETRCDPPLERDRVTAQVRGAVKRAREHPLARRRARPPGASRCSPSSPPTAPPRPARRSRRGRSAPLIVPLVEFLGGSEDDAAWLVDHLAARGALVVVAGLPKVGKSHVRLRAARRAHERRRPVRRAAGRVDAVAADDRGAAGDGRGEGRPVRRRRRARVRDLEAAVARRPHLGEAIVDAVVDFCRAHPEVGVVVVDTLDKFADLDRETLGGRHRRHPRDDRPALPAARPRRLRGPDHAPAQGGGRATGCACAAAPR